MSLESAPEAELARLRRRVVDLELRADELLLEAAQARAEMAPGPMAWLLTEGVRRSEQVEWSSMPMEKGLFSVIIPAFNAEAFLARAVESVRAQTLTASRIEIIVADDGSRDGTRALAERLSAGKGAPLRLVAHAGGVNRGVAATRNLAVANARGEFLALLDADDAFLPERLEVTGEYLQAHPEYVAVCSLGRNVDELGRTVNGHNGTEVAGAWCGLDAALHPPFTFDMLWKVDPVANSSLTVRRDAFLRVGGFPAVMAHQAEDWLLVLKLSLLAPLPCIERELFLYTHHAGAYTHAYHAGGWREGARLELFYQTAHWMLRQPELRDQAATFFRQQFPRVLGSHSRLFAVVRDYCALHGSAAPTLTDFEDQLARNMAELESLRRVVQARSREARRWRQEALALRGRIAALNPGQAP